MPKHKHSQSKDALDELVRQLLECGGALSQVVASMVRFQAAGRSAPDAAPIPVVAHSLIRSILDDVGRRYSDRDLKTAAAIVEEATEAICHEIFIVDPAKIRRLTG